MNNSFGIINENIKNLSEMFKKAGLYIFEYLNLLENNEIAKEISDKFYKYGVSLQTKEKK